VEDLKTEEAEHGQWHPHVAITLNNLGRALKAQGNIKDAYLYFQRALETAEIAEYVSQDVRTQSHFRVSGTEKGIINLESSLEI
jgi:tetratricopeptide (TPR) repeat protein